MTVCGRRPLLTFELSGFNASLAAASVVLLLAAHAPLAAVGWSQWDATMEVRHPAACY